MKKLTVFIVLAVVLSSGGCNYGPLVGLMGTESYHERKITAEYNLAEHTDQKLLVLVDQPGWLNADVNIRYYLTKAINKNLVASVEVVAEKLVPYSGLAEFRSDEPNFSLLSPIEVGSALDANMVLLVAIEDYYLDEMGGSGYYGGFLVVRSILLDTTTGEKLWPESARGKTIKVGFDAERRGKLAAVARLATACAFCTTRYLYDCPKNKFRIIEDKTEIGW